ncbi:MAG TPA: hypothetical protein VHL11_25605 [Phototrophicaceae bacterium]|nr:hypothetical protein [Phototrophicaceae bacterium]
MTDLRGTIKYAGAVTRGVVTNTSVTCAYEVGLAVYRRFDSVIDHQELFSSATGIVLPGQTLTLGPVNNPGCASQIDLFYGPILTSLYHQRYGFRILRAINVGTQYCSGTKGCTPGYWKNHEDAWSDTGFTPGQSTVSMFTGAAVFPNLAVKTLLESLQGDGGPTLEDKAKILLRAGVAAELNASDPLVDYPRSAGQVLDQVNAALQSGSADTIIQLATTLDNDNNLGCPLN